MISSASNVSQFTPTLYGKKTVVKMRPKVTVKRKTKTASPPTIRGKKLK